MDEGGVPHRGTGRLPAALAAELDRFEVTEAGDASSLTGLVSDSAALYGLLARLEAVGLALMAVAQLHADTTTDRGDTP